MVEIGFPTSIIFSKLIPFQHSLVISNSILLIMLPSCQKMDFECLREWWNFGLGRTNVVEILSTKDSTEFTRGNP